MAQLHHSHRHVIESVRLKLLSFSEIQYRPYLLSVAITHPIIHLIEPRPCLDVRYCRVPFTRFSLSEIPPVIRVVPQRHLPQPIIYFLLYGQGLGYAC
jgi:hypothetical protein